MISRDGCELWFLLWRALAAPRAAAGLLAGGMVMLRAEKIVFPGRFRAPVTWVFSLYVVQAGLARR